MTAAVQVETRKFEHISQMFRFACSKPDRIGLNNQQTPISTEDIKCTKKYELQYKKYDDDDDNNNNECFCKYFTNTSL